MNLVTRELMARAAPLRLAMQHRGRMNMPGHDGRTPQDKYLKLAVSDLSPDAVDAIMGSKSWTTITCSCCRKKVPRAVNVDLTAGEYSTEVCEECVKNM